MSSTSATTPSTATSASWNPWARTYDRQLAFERAALAVAVALVDPHPQDVVLDIGTGTGGLLRTLARHPGRPCDAIGVDESPSMLDSSQALPSGWSLERGDARRLRFADATFTVVTAAYLLQVIDVTARRAIIAEAHRVLRAGGRLITVTPTWPRSRIARMIYRPLAAAAGSSVGPRSAFRPLDPRAELRAAGFTVVAERYVGRGYPSICLAATH